MEPGRHNGSDVQVRPRPVSVDPDDIFFRVFRSGPAALAITRLSDGRIIDVNESLETILGYSRAEMIGRTTVELGLWDSPRREFVDRIRHEGAVRDVEMAWRTPHGIVRTRTSMQLIDFGGEPCLLTLFVDETAKLRAIEELRASEERYKTVVRDATDAIMILGPEDRYVDVNDAACRLLGYSREEFLSMGPFDLATEDQFEMQRQQIGIVRTGGYLRTERKLRTKDGQVIWVELTGSKLSDGTTEAIIRDITARREAEERAERLLKLYAASADIDRAIARTEDTKTLFREACRIAVEVGGFGLAWVGVVDDESPTKELRIAASAGEPTNYLNSIRAALDPDTPGGRRPAGRCIREDRPILFAVDSAGLDPAVRASLREAGLSSAISIPLRIRGRGVGAVSVYHPRSDAFGPAEIGLLERIADDVSFRLEAIAEQQARELAEAQRDALEEQLLQSQKMEAVGRLAGGIAHDFNNLLTAIGGYASLARAQLGDSPVAEDVAGIEQATARAAELTRQLLAFARRSPIARDALDVNRILADLVPMVRRMIGEDIELVIVPGELSGRVIGDAGQLQQVILNLVVNAKDAMPQGGVIAIETHPVRLDEEALAAHPEAEPGPYVLISVKDTGCGISPDILDRIFEPFFTTKETGKGTGLGLSMVFGTVKSFGGAIEVDSSPGLGTAFKIFLPLDETAGLGPAAEPRAAIAVERTRAAETEPSGQTILIVEDEESVRRYAVRVLQGAGFKVLQARDGREAVALVERHGKAIDLVMTDVVMPGMSGPEAVELIRSLCPGVPALFVSGYAERDMAGRQFARSSFMQKPYEGQAVLQQIRRMLANESGG